MGGSMVALEGLSHAHAELRRRPRRDATDRYDYLFGTLRDVSRAYGEDNFGGKGRAQQRPKVA